MNNSGITRWYTQPSRTPVPKFKKAGSRPIAHAFAALCLMTTLVGRAAGDGLPPAWVPDYGSAITAWTGNADDGLAAVNLNGANTGFSFAFGGSTYLSATVSTNGFITLGSSPANSEPSPCAGPLQPCAGALNSKPTIAPAWYDLDALDSDGSIYFNNTIPGEAVFTWVNAGSFAPPPGQQVPNSDLATFQLVLGQDGSITMSYDQFNSATSIIGSANALIGFSTGNNASDSGPSASTLLTGPGGFTTGNTFYSLVTSSTATNLSGLDVVFTPGVNNTWSVSNSTSTITGVPEPSTILYAMSGLLAIGVVVRKARR